MNIAGLVEDMRRDGAFDVAANDPGAQFGLPNRNYIGASLLPERNTELEFTETGLTFFSPIANEGTRYSAVQKKRGTRIQTQRITLGHQDAGDEFTARDYDALRNTLRTGTASQQAMTTVLNWFDRVVTTPLRERIELARWQALVNAQVIRTGDDNYRELVNYPNPTGHRVNVAGDWDNDAYDPFEGDILPMADFLQGKGFTINRIIAGRTVINKLSNNTLVQQRIGILAIAGGVVVGRPGRATPDEINGLFERNNLPPIERYDLQYRTQTGSGFFLPRDAMVMCCTTGRDVDLSDQVTAQAGNVIISDTLGYAAIGPAAGRDDSGRQTVVTVRQRKPPAIVAEGWQASLPVILDVEAIGVLKNIV